MKKFDRQMDEYGKRLLAPLRKAPKLDQRVSEEIKQNYLLQGENLRKHLAIKPDELSVPDQQRGRLVLRKRITLPISRILAATLITLLILIGSSATVFAAQNSLPGEPLYIIKSISENIRLSLTTSPQAKLDLMLRYTDRRIGEIATLVSNGKDVPDKMSEKVNGDLENALILASQMDDKSLTKALGQINRNAESQGITVEELINKLPDQAEPAIIHLQQRLQEQVILSELGKDNLKAFRKYMWQRHNYLNDKNLPSSTPSSSNTPDKQDKEKKNNNGKAQPSDIPGHEKTPPGQDKSKDK